MLVFLFLYVILSILLSILVCAAASLFGQCQILQDVQIMEEALMIFVCGDLNIDLLKHESPRNALEMPLT